MKKYIDPNVKTEILVVTRSEMPDLDLTELPIDYSILAHNVAQNKFGVAVPTETGHVLFEGVTTFELLEAAEKQGLLSEDDIEHARNLKHEFIVIRQPSHMGAVLNYIPVVDQCSKDDKHFIFDFMPEGESKVLGFANTLLSRSSVIGCELTGNATEWGEGQYPYGTYQAPIFPKEYFEQFNELSRPIAEQYVVFKLSDEEYSALKKGIFKFDAKCKAGEFGYHLTSESNTDFHCFSSIEAVFEGAFFIEPAMNYFLPAQLFYNTDLAHGVAFYRGVPEINKEIVLGSMLEGYFSFGKHKYNKQDVIGVFNFTSSDFDQCPEPNARLLAIGLNSYQIGYSSHNNAIVIYEDDEMKEVAITPSSFEELLHGSKHEMSLMGQVVNCLASIAVHFVQDQG